ncbi:MAG: hypothetical protein AB1627_02540 [Chloroflexota bacterium]
MAKNLTQAVRDEADEIRTVTLAQAAEMPGLLGRVVDAHLRLGRGWYGCVLDGRKVLFVLAK